MLSSLSLRGRLLVWLLLAMLPAMGMVLYLAAESVRAAHFQSAQHARQLARQVAGVEKAAIGAALEQLSAQAPAGFQVGHYDLPAGVLTLLSSGGAAETRTGRVSASWWETVSVPVALVAGTGDKLAGNLDLTDEQRLWVRTAGKTAAEGVGLVGGRWVGFAKLEGRLPAVRARGPAETVWAVVTVASPVGEMSGVFWRTLAGGAGLGLLVLAWVWLGEKRLTFDRLDALTAAARRVKAGDWNTRSGVPYWQGEIGELAFAFDLMAQARQRAEEALKEQRNELRALIDTIPDRIFIKDREGKYLVANQAYAEFHGLDSPEAVVGKTVFELLPRELAERYHADDLRIIESGQPQLNKEEPIVDKQGRQRLILTTKVPYRSATGRIIGLACISRDITERHSG